MHILQERSGFLVCVSRRPQAPQLHGGGFGCLFELSCGKQALPCEGDRTKAAGRGPPAKPIRSALQMCLFGSHGVSFLNIKISCQAAKMGVDFYFRKTGYTTCHETLGWFGHAGVHISARAASSCSLLAGPDSPGAPCCLDPAVTDVPCVTVRSRITVSTRETAPSSVRRPRVSSDSPLTVASA